MGKKRVVLDAAVEFDYTAEEVQEAILRYAGFKGESRDGSRKANELVSFKLNEDGSVKGSYK